MSIDVEARLRDAAHEPNGCNSPHVLLSEALEAVRLARLVPAEDEGRHLVSAVGNTGYVAMPVPAEDEGRLRWNVLAAAAQRILALPVEQGRDAASWLAAIHAAADAALAATPEPQHVHTPRCLDPVRRDTDCDVDDLRRALAATPEPLKETP